MANTSCVHHEELGHLLNLDFKLTVQRIQTDFLKVYNLH
jgi:hypothetical protein